MGGTKSKDSSYYDPTLNAELVDENKECKFYRNQKGEQFEKYKIKHKGNYDFDNRYEYRIKNSSPYLVDAYSAKSSQNAFGCASNDQYEVVTERIPLRLYQMNNLTGAQALNMANKALKGFQQIFKSQGVLLVKDSMIGINKQQNVKVWMNSNFAVNQIEQLPISYGVLSDPEKESTMVDNIVELINSRSQRDPLWVDFVEEKYRQGRIGFDQAIRLTELEASKHNAHIFDHFGTTVQSAISYSHAKVTQDQTNQKDFQYPYQIPAIKNSSAKNSAVINSQKFLVQNMNQTATSSMGPMNVSSNININPQIPTHQPTGGIVSNSNVRLASQAPQGIAGLKNRIVHGQAPNMNQVAFSVGSKNNNNNMPLINPNFVNNVPRPPPAHSTSVDNGPKHFINQVVNLDKLPSPNVQFQSPNAQFVRPVPIIPNGKPALEVSSSKPRAQSSGKPVVTFGNKVVSYSGANQFSSNIRPVTIPPIVAQTPVFEQVRGNPIRAPQEQPAISNIQLEGRKQQVVLQLNEPTKYQICPEEVKVTQRVNQPKALNVIVTAKQVVYPPPNKVVNFERKIQIAQSKYVEDANNNKIVSNQRNLPQITEEINRPKIDEKLQKSEHIMRQMDVLQKSIKQNSIEKSPPVQNKIDYNEENEGEAQKRKKVTKNLTFGVTTSLDVNQSSQSKNQVIETGQKPLQNGGWDNQTPFFGRQSKTKTNEITNKRQLNENQVDHILAYEEEQLKNIKEVQVKTFGIKHAESKEQDQSTIMKQNVQKAKNEPQAELELDKVKESKNLANNQKKDSHEQKSNVVRDEKNFKKAVQESASNIRMEASKISIRSSSDLKGIISYRDLRDLLKTTRKQPSN